ncbi:RND transporter [Pandoraea terrae]|uniref:RND transporter n=1 Tax=Pandoraea terrae TaxID=1537710 RepID=A0A5E4T221_9BURK|nr:efflux transporter outer membrane subunit [Pandoraea terrae]VVD81322.1 RND transporter [Pandoraea terrae]
MDRTRLPLLLAGLLAACSLEPAYQRPAAPVPPAFPTGPAYQTTPAGANGKGNGANVSGAPGQSAADIGWQDFFVDARLKQLIELALANNRDLRMTALSIDAARAAYRIRRAAQFPAINATAGETTQHLPSDVRLPGQASVVSQFDAGIGFNAFELDFFGRVRSLKHDALEQYLATEEAHRSAQISLVAEVANAYLTFQADQALLKLSQDTLNGQQQSVEVVQRSMRAGALAQLDLNRASTQVDTAQVAVEQYTRQVAKDENALALLIGGPVPPSAIAANAPDGQRMLADLPGGLPSDLLLHRPDIIAAEHQLKAANANIGAARAAFFPTISLTGQLGLASATLAGLFSAGTAAWLFSPQISLPIFNAGSNRANLDLANVRKDINIANYEKTIQTAFREVADGLASRGTLDRQVKAQEKLVEHTQETYHLSQMRFRAGIDDYFAEQDAQRSLFTAQQALVTLRLARETNQVSLYKALGGGWTKTTQAPQGQQGPQGQTPPIARK